MSLRQLLLAKIGFRQGEFAMLVVGQSDSSKPLASLQGYPGHGVVVDYSSSNGSGRADLLIARCIDPLIVCS